MKELVRNLTDGADNALARLFHIDLKGLVVKGLDILASMPELKMNDFEHYNSREFLNLRDWLLEHEKVPRQRKHYKAICNFIIMLYDSDEAYRLPMYQVIKKLKELPLKEEELPRPELWQE